MSADITSGDVSAVRGGEVGAEYEPAPAQAACDGLSTPEVLDAVPGLTYRRLDYWRRTGRVAAHTHDISGRTGSGIHFCWSQSEVTVIALINAFTAFGFELEAAAALARNPERMRDLSRLLNDQLGAVAA